MKYFFWGKLQIQCLLLCVYEMIVASQFYISAIFQRRRCREVTDIGSPPPLSVEIGPHHKNWDSWQHTPLIGGSLPAPILLIKFCPILSRSIFHPVNCEKSNYSSVLYSSSRDNSFIFPVVLFIFLLVFFMLFVNL